MNIQIAGGIEEDFPTSIHDSFNDLVHSIIQCTGAFTGVRQQAIPFGAEVCRIRKVLLDQQRCDSGLDCCPPDLINSRIVTLNTNGFIQSDERFGTSNRGACFENRPD